MVLENVVIMECCNENLCSRSEYLGGERGAKKGNSKAVTTTGGTGLLMESRGCLNHAIRFLFKSWYVCWHQLNSKKIGPVFFFPHYIKPTKRFPVVSCY